MEAGQGAAAVFCGDGRQQLAEHSGVRGDARQVAVPGEVEADDVSEEGDEVGEGREVHA